MNQRIALGITVSALPVAAHASDFAILAVALGCLVITVLNIVLGIVATHISRRRGLPQAAPYLGVIVILLFIGVGLVMDEAKHMADSDFKGLMLMLIIPSALSFCVPLFVKTKKDSQSE